MFNPVGASPASILDRFAEVEGVSGSNFADVLKGDNVDAVTIVNHGGATGSALTNVALIRGLQQFWPMPGCRPLALPPATSCSAAMAAT